MCFFMYRCYFFAHNCTYIESWSQFHLQHIYNLHFLIFKKVPIYLAIYVSIKKLVMRGRKPLLHKIQFFFSWKRCQQYRDITKIGCTHCSDWQPEVHKEIIPYKRNECSEQDYRGHSIVGTLFGDKQHETYLGSQFSIYDSMQTTHQWVIMIGTMNVVKLCDVTASFGILTRRLMQQRLTQWRLTQRCLMKPHLTFIVHDDDDDDKVLHMYVRSVKFVFVLQLH